MSFSLNNILKDFFLDSLWQVFYFPIWWYSWGLKKTAFFCFRKIRGSWQSLSLSILLANFFKPMYGQKGASAYFLSILTHLLQISFRFFFFILWLIFWLLILILWIILPLFIIWQLLV